MSEYISTRGAHHESPITYSDSLLAGLAPDRGLFVPSELPEFSIDEIRALDLLDYPSLFVAVRSKFVGSDIAIHDQQLMATRAYTPEKFPNVEKGNYATVRYLDNNIYLQNLSQGPTAAFKDMAMQALGQDMQYVLDKRNEHLTILGATSGDTGSSAEAALKGLSRVSLFMMSPKTGMSEFQRAQMAELTGGNIHNIAIDGRFSAFQDLMKEIKKDPEFSDLGAVNSINWARVASQIPYYFSGYLQAFRGRSDIHIGDEVDFVIPSGNMGNALSAYLAKRMGLPIGKIVVATNENDVLHKLIQTGEYRDIKEAAITSSPSMDISKASNYERIVFDLLGNDPVKTKRYMELFENTGSVTFADINEPTIDLKKVGFDSGTSTHKKRLETIDMVYQQHEEIIDPHTADGVAVALARDWSSSPTIVMETALAVKFEPTIEEAIGFTPDRELRFRDIEAALNRGLGFAAIACDLDELKSFVRANR